MIGCTLTDLGGITQSGDHSISHETLQQWLGHLTTPLLLFCVTGIYSHVTRLIPINGLISILVQTVVLFLTALPMGAKRRQRRGASSMSMHNFTPRRTSSMLESADLGHHYITRVPEYKTAMAFTSFLLCLGDSFLSEGCASVRTAACDMDSEASSALMPFPFFLLLLQKQAEDNETHLTIQKHTQQLMAVLLLKPLFAGHTMDDVTHMRVSLNPTDKTSLHPPRVPDAALHLAESRIVAEED
ncbi:MAG: hypothetical protein FRX49_09049 [Trebouxia sp. A1-2]|nr:MAG: hypothetical protein FRX49_09049 [Trebouxia sp. A1-2]